MGGEAERNRAVREKKERGGGGRMYAMTVVKPPSNTHDLGLLR